MKKDVMRGEKRKTHVALKVEIQRAEGAMGGRAASNVENADGNHWRYQHVVDDDIRNFIFGFVAYRFPDIQSLNSSRGIDVQWWLSMRAITNANFQGTHSCVINTGHKAGCENR